MPNMNQIENGTLLSQLCPKELKLSYSIKFVIFIFKKIKIGYIKK